MGRGLSMGIQYLWQEARSDSAVKGYSKIPNCMQLLLQLSFCRLLFNKLPSNLQFLSWTRFKPLRVMEDKVTSRVCNLMLNIMHASLLSLHVNGCIPTSSSDSPQVMASNESQTVQAVYLQEIQQSREAQNWDWLTILVIYDGICSLCCTTDLLKDGCLACISPPNDKDAKVWT